MFSVKSERETEQHWPIDSRLSTSLFFDLVLSLFCLSVSERGEIAVIIKGIQALTYISLTLVSSLFAEQHSASGEDQAVVRVRMPQSACMHGQRPRSHL